MGLDMYLNASRYLWTFPEDGEDAKLAKEIAKLCGVQQLTAKTIEISVGQWRKANQIHAWFVANVQDGVDECNAHNVNREQLRTLRAVCTEVLANKEKAHELLPVQAGFFFGSTNYDEWYFADLEDTIKIIDEALALPEQQWDLTYQSSW